MEYRYQLLAETLEGFNKSGVPLVAADGDILKAAGFADDPAIYYFIPKIIKLFGFSLESGIDIFFIGILFVSLMAGIFASVKYCKTGAGKVWAVLNILLIGYVSLRVGDLYSISPAVTLFTVPLFLFVYGKGELRMLLTFVIAAGLLCGLANETRAHAGSAAFLFIFVFLLFEKTSARNIKALTIGLFILGFSVPSIFFSLLVAERDRYLSDNMPGYQQEGTGNTMWHSVYIGLGYLNNPFVKQYRDDVGFSKANEIKPGVSPFSSEYENILRGEVFETLSGHPYFAVQNFSAKGGVLLFFFVLFANVGIAALWFYGARSDVALPLVVAIMFSALPGLLVVPYHEYLLGFFAFVVIFNFLQVDEAFSKGVVADMRKFASRGIV